MLKTIARLERSAEAFALHLVAALVALLGGTGAVAVRAESGATARGATASSARRSTPAPNRAPGEGFGPYKTMVVRGAMLIDGTGGPPRGPVDIVVNGNRITQIRNAGTPGMPLRPNRGPQADYEIDATGMYVMPGFVDLHVHAGGAPKNPDAEYPYKLWLAHGVTTVRGVPLTDNALAVKEKERSARNEIVAPRIFNYQRPGIGWGKGVPQHRRRARTPGSNGRTRNGVDGIKLGAERPDLMEIYCSGREEARHGHDRASAADRRRAGERDQGRAHGPRHGHAFLRTLRIAAEGLRRPAVSGDAELQQRAGSLRPGRAAVGQDPSAGQPRVEGVPRGAPEARDDVRSDADDLLGRTRRHALPRRRVARQVHAAVADGRSTRPTARTTARTGTTGPPRTKSRSATSTRSGSS